MSTIEIETKYFVLAFLLALFKPKAAIDGYEVPIKWGVTAVPVQPGRHQVEAWLPYIFLSQMGRNGTVVDVAPGQAVRVRWDSPWLVFLKGKVTVLPPTGAQPVQQAEAFAPAGSPPPAAAPAAGAWHPDPSGRHELRYFDGAAWTDHVSDQGVAATDPLGA